MTYGLVILHFFLTVLCAYKMLFINGNETHFKQSFKTFDLVFLFNIGQVVHPAVVLVRVELLEAEKGVQPSQRDKRLDQAVQHPRESVQRA